MTTDLNPEQTAPAPFLRRHATTLTALTFWVAVVGGWWLYANANDLTVADTVRALNDLLTGTLLGPLIYIVVYALRPLIFFPATLLTVLSGFIFGPLGILYTVVGANSSAMVAYGVGAFFGKDVVATDNAGLLQRYATRMRNNSFETVLLLRLLFLPYDLVNYAAGFFKISWKAFLLATIIGSIPGTISFSLLGMSFGTLDELLGGELALNPWALLLSVLLIGGSILLSRFLRKREGVDA